MDVLGIVLSLFLLMFMAYRGFSVILFAPVFALLAAALQGLPVMPSYTELFMAKAVVYIKSFFPIFMLGAVFGKGHGGHSSREGYLPCHHAETGTKTCIPCRRFILCHIDLWRG